MIIAINLVFLLFLSWWFSKHTSPFKTHWYWIGISMRVAAGLVLGSIYLNHIQSGDTLAYFQQAQDISSLTSHSIVSFIKRLFTNEFPPYKGEYRAEFFSKILSFFLILTEDNYWLSSVYLSLISFLGGWLLVRSFVELNENNRWPAYISFLLIPSVVFWSSGILKDGLANACFFYLSTFLIRYYHQRPISLLEHLIYAISLIFLIKLRFYLGAFMIIGIALVIFNRFIVNHISRSSIKFMIYAVFILGVLFGVSFIDYNLQFNHLPQSIYLNYQAILQSSGELNVLHFDISPNWFSIIKNLPKSFIYGLFGPFPGQDLRHPSLTGSKTVCFLSSF
ncbi:MAG: hypothetical protein ACFHWX_03555 [Bacteroidota bacterium]